MNNRPQLIVRHGSVVTPEGVTTADVAVADGVIAAVGPNLSGAGAEEIDATGLHVFPGILDAHVHFNEPGRADWEGLGSGAAALAAGGGAWFCDMPLNSTPPVLDGAAFAAKRGLAEAKSVTDFSLWGGLVPGNLDRLAELRDAGAIGLKAFMCGSGIEDFPGVTDAVILRAGMTKAAELGLLVAVHAEDETMAARLTEAARARGATDPRSWLATRPGAVELAAIRVALELAGETGCALHIVHVSSPEGIGLVTEAKRKGLNVTAETCPHYLLLTDDDVVRLGAPAKCAPPLRSEAARKGLWQRVAAGAVDTIGSDHSPAPPGMKTAADFFAIWGGISGVQHGFPLLLSDALSGSLGGRALPVMAGLLAANVAKRFRLPNKGRVAAGHDADFSLLDLAAPHELRNEDLLYRHQQGPYAGRRCRVKVRKTFVRGRVVWDGTNVAAAAPKGRFVAPAGP
ncbi:MAG TPA: allantoinase AllB [Opitutaceae bacterium]|nr:allantoinase AllB [Opitutaceae bacterium]